MAEDKYVAAIEISSSKVLAVVGKYNRENGELDVVAVEQEKGLESVKYGLIRNVEEVWMRIARLVQRLESKPAVSPRKITGVFVGLSGVSLRSIPVPVSINLSEDSEITDDIIERLLQQAQRSAIDSTLEVVDAVPRVYKVGQQESLSPKGMVGNKIDAEFDLIVCRKEMKRNIMRIFDDKLKSQLKMRGLVVTALATGQLVLSDEEKRLGCMLVDMGAETTTVTIYKNGHLVYFVTLPMGGRNITRDITSLKLLEEKAEEIKIASGNALPRTTTTTLNFGGVKDSDISNLIVARAEEIIVNVLKQIKYAELEDSDLPAGIICIGGGSKLNGLMDLLSDKSGLSVRRGSIPKYVHIHDLKVNSSELIEVVSVLYAGATGADEVCLETIVNEPLPENGFTEEEEEEEVVINEPVVKRPSFFSRMLKRSKDSISGMFTDVEDESENFE